MTLVRVRYRDKRNPGRMYGKEEGEKQDLDREKNLQRGLLFDFLHKITQLNYSE